MKIGLKLTSEMHPFQTTFTKMKPVQYYRLVVFYAVYISCIFLAVAVKTVKGYFDSLFSCFILLLRIKKYITIRGIKIRL